MNTELMIQQVTAERDRLNRILSELKPGAARAPQAVAKSKSKGKKPKTNGVRVRSEAAKKAQAETMRLVWAARKKAAAKGKAPAKKAPAKKAVKKVAPRIKRAIKQTGDLAKAAA